MTDIEVEIERAQLIAILASGTRVTASLRRRYLSVLEADLATASRASGRREPLPRIPWIRTRSDT